MLFSNFYLDNIELLVHSGIFSSIQCILGCLEKAWGKKYDFQRPCPMAVVVDEVRHNATSIRNLSGAEMANLMKSGTRVIRGPDWKWGDQVSSKGSSIFTSTRFSELCFTNFCTKNLRI